MTLATTDAPAAATVDLSQHPHLGPVNSELFIRLLRARLIDESEAAVFLDKTNLTAEDTVAAAAEALQAAGLMTAFQARRITSGRLHGLRLGNYRVLEQIGRGTTGTVYRAEHIFLRRPVAVKVLSGTDGLTGEAMRRFHAEIRVLARLEHPHIVTAYDAGVVTPPPGTPGASLHYLIMELVPGGDLMRYVQRRDEKVAPAQACEWVRQAAAGLQEAHDHRLIHRDIKPSNLLLGDHGQVKLVDFGLVRGPGGAGTNPKSLMGSVEFMAPEQAADPTLVSAAADIYGLGATLFWLLTGEAPYPHSDNITEMLRRLHEDRPRRLCEVRTDLPDSLGEVVDRLLSRDPQGRPSLPITVMCALARFAAPASGTWDPSALHQAAAVSQDSTMPGSQARPWRVLTVDKSAMVRSAVNETLAVFGAVCDEAADGRAGLRMARECRYDLVVLDRDLTEPDGYAVATELCQKPGWESSKILLLSPSDGSRELAEAKAFGADALTRRPIDPLRLAAEAERLLRLKEAQDRAGRLTEHLLASNRQLEDSLLARAGDVRKAQDAILHAMAKMAESREGETAGHLLRLQRYTMCLADALADHADWKGLLTPTFRESLTRCVPLHDIGKLGLPDSVLFKPGRLTPDERALVETHPVVGSDLLEAVAREYGDSFSHLAVARQVVRHHHERYDGAGYPDKLSGTSIPPAARLVAIPDVYDALRRKRSFKPPMSHLDAVGAIVADSDGHFDPVILVAFEKTHHEFDKIYQAVPN